MNRPNLPLIGAVGPWAWSLAPLSYDEEKNLRPERGALPFVDRLLATGSSFDWFSPLLQAMEERFLGMATIGITDTAGMTCMQVIARLEAEWSVWVGTPLIVKGVLLLTVDSRSKAEDALRRMGCAMLGWEE